MLRRSSILAVFLLCFGTAALALRPMLRPLANLDEPTSPNPEAVRLALAAMQPRTAYGRRLEPAGNLILHGAGQTDRTSFDRYTAALQPTAPMLFMTYVDLRDDLPTFFARLQADLDHFEATTPGSPIMPRLIVPRLIVPQIGLSLNRGTAAGHYETATATGADDPALQQLCTGLRALDRPVYLRIGYEFNGPWNGYTSVAYKAAFRRIANTVHACTSRVALVWNWSADAELDAEAAGLSPSTLPDRLRDAYPGDDAVDWWAVNLFSPQGITAPSTEAFLRAAAASRHPVMIAESTPKGLRLDTARDTWFAPYFGLLRSHPGIRAFCYIDWNWAAYPQWSDWGDARIEQDPGLLAWLRTALHDPTFQHSTTRAATLHLLHADNSPSTKP